MQLLSGDETVPVAALYRTVFLRLHSHRHVCSVETVSIAALLSTHRSPGPSSLVPGPPRSCKVRLLSGAGLHCRRPPEHTQDRLRPHSHMHVADLARPQRPHELGAAVEARTWLVVRDAPELLNHSAKNVTTSSPGSKEVDTDTKCTPPDINDDLDCAIKRTLNSNRTDFNVDGEEPEVDFTKPSIAAAHKECSPSPSEAQASLPTLDEAAWQYYRQHLDEHTSLTKLLEKSEGDPTETT
ncbi:uncharacterized protein E0L32_011374 [Thyridium curvatum]|uniref:Uncharacterized protein n=1 Tax=Thyridium curvatum TaxID=1093900 RepID=A0A507BNW0_9PEZI|nr:uncharacterized protein E0L32_011374 [Thyridium curvatum]TPX18981.1 hypothetical protein E0L32_011374 [Thyridium curvatum]